jgi:septum formation protein
MLENLSKYKIILGSQSPRRKELLAGLDIPFEVKPMPDVDENYPSSLWKEEIPVYIARQKANAYRRGVACNALTDNNVHNDPIDNNHTLLITADTIVWLEGKVYGKPTDEADAKTILRALSGKTHEVITGVCLTTQEKQQAFYAVSSVKFAELDDEEIDYYVQKYRPYDKAGAYGVQEWIGYIGVESLKGSFYNVMGLPVRMLYKYLKAW